MKSQLKKSEKKHVCLGQTYKKYLGQARGYNRFNARNITSLTGIAFLKLNLRIPILISDQ